MVGMGLVGRTLRVDSLTNKGCIFGSMAGLAPTVGLNPNLMNVYRSDTTYCTHKCIPPGIDEQESSTDSDSAPYVLLYFL